MGFLNWWKARKPSLLGRFGQYAADCWSAHRSTKRIKQAYECLEQRFPEVVAAAGFHCWRPGDPIAATGTRLLIGIELYDHRQLVMLDIVSDHLKAVAVQPVTVDVFDVGNSAILDVLNALGGDRYEALQVVFEAYLPNTKGKSVGAPMAGVWRNGQFVAGEPNGRCIAILASELRISEKELFYS